MQLGGIFGFVSVPRGAYVVKSAAQSMLHMVELHAEPEGGEEMAQLKKVTGMRMKNMGPVQGVTGKSGGQAYNFWMTAIAPGELVKEIRSKITKDASKNANFPGFRKGQIPPYAQPKMTGFALQESIINTVEAAVGAYGLLALEGSDGEVNVNEDIQEINKSYKLGDDVQFTATLKCEFDSTKQRPVETPTVDEPQIEKATAE